MKKSLLSSANPEKKSYFRRCFDASIIVFLTTFACCFAHYWCWWRNAIPYHMSTRHETYTLSTPPKLPVLNSITNNPDFNEIAFIEVKDVNSKESDYLGVSLEPGHEYEVTIYCCNDMVVDDIGEDQGIATNVRIAVDLPKKYTSQTPSRSVGGYFLLYDHIGATIAYNDGVNDAPQVVSACSEVFSDKTLKIKYVPGSAKILSAGKVNESKLSDHLFRPQGIPIGYDALDGQLPGGREYACIVTFRFRTSPANWSVLDEIYNTYYRP